MRQVGNRNFFRRNNQWVDSQVTEKQAANAQRIMQFSDEYFQLAEATAASCRNTWCSTNRCCSTSKTRPI